MNDCCVPTVEVCGDSLDNDCDDLTDCDDPNCAAAPSCIPPTEICGDCQDNDGDGLVDYEDSDCCAQKSVLGLMHMTLQPTAAYAGGGRLKLTTMYSTFPPASLDPLTQDTSLQISDGHGQIFCATIGASHWTRLNRRTVGFYDKPGSFAGGLTDGRFIVKRNGSVTFRTHGRGLYIPATDGQGIRITVRAGNECSQAMAALRPRRTALVFP